MKPIRKRFIESEYAPEDTNVIWVKLVNGKENPNNIQIEDMLQFVNGKWGSIINTDTSDNSGVTIPEGSVKIKFVYNDQGIDEPYPLAYIKSGVLPTISTPLKESGYIINVVPVSIVNSNGGDLIVSSFIVRESNDRSEWDPNNNNTGKVIEATAWLSSSTFSDSMATWTMNNDEFTQEFLDIYKVE